MPIQKQLSVFLPNRPGALARACSVLSDSSINLVAVAVHDTIDNAVVRFLVDQPTKALLLLEQEDFYVIEQDVVMIDIEHHPGVLTEVCQKLAQADINIAYAYCTANTKEKGCGCLVLRTDEPERALDVLVGI